jgi:hypothetical protein
LICGDGLLILTNAHAIKHGYANKQALIQDGKVIAADYWRPFPANKKRAVNKDGH